MFLIIILAVLISSNSYASEVNKIDDQTILIKESRNISIDDLKRNYETALNARNYYQKVMDDIEANVNLAVSAEVSDATTLKETIDQVKD